MTPSFLSKQFLYQTPGFYEFQGKFEHLTQSSISGESIGLKFIPSQSELFRFIPIFVSELMRIIPNQSEKRFVSRLMKKGQKSIRLNPIHSEIWKRTNPNQSGTKFSIQVNPKQSEPDWKLHFRFLRIGSLSHLGMNRIKPDWFLTVFHQTRYKTFFGLVRNDSHWLGMNFNLILSTLAKVSDWNSLRVNRNYSSC